MINNLFQLFLLTFNNCFNYFIYLLNWETFFILENYLLIMNETECVPICAREIQNLHHSRMLSTNLFNLRQCGSLCDVTLDCSGTLISAHRVVLAACSKYFEAMFTSGMWETGKAKVILIYIFISLHNCLYYMF